MSTTVQDKYQGKTRREYKRMKAHLPGNSNPGKNKVVTCQAIPIEKAMIKYPRSIKTSPRLYFEINLRKDIQNRRNSFFTKEV